MDDDLFEEILRRGKRAAAARPDVPAGDLLFTVAGPEEAGSVAEVNAAGEVLRFVCVRVDGASSGVVVPGSVRKTCGRCGAAVWISPATLQTHDRIEKPVIVCLECTGLLSGGDR